MIVLMVGSSAQRMGRGVRSVDTTKGLMEIPKMSGGTETLIDRTIRLLKKTGAVKRLNDILMCTGYKEKDIKRKYSRCRFLTTYDPDNPTDLLPAYLKLIDAFPGEEQFIIFLGDVVWSEGAMKHFLAVTEKAPLVFYHCTNQYYTDIFSIAINGDKAKSLIRQAIAVKDMPVIKGEIKWQIKGITRITPKDCRTSTFEQWIDLKKLPGKLRVYQAGAVDDIDWDIDHKKICNEIRQGKYGMI